MAERSVSCLDDSLTIEQTEFNSAREIDCDIDFVVDYEDSVDAMDDFDDEYFDCNDCNDCNDRDSDSDSDSDIDIYATTDDETLPENSVFRKYQFYKNYDILLLSLEKIKTISKIEKARKSFNYYHIYRINVDLYQSMKFKVLNKNLQKNIICDCKVNQLFSPFVVERFGFTGLKNYKRIINKQNIIKHRVKSNSPLCNY